jgi:hypothetical protein
VVDVQPRVRYERVHQPCVGQRDDRVVVARDDQRRLAEQRQERQAGPARSRGELVQVPPRRPDPVPVVHRHRDPSRVGPRRPPVQVARDLLQVAAVKVTPRRHQLREHRGLGRHHEGAGSRGDEHQAAAPRTLERGEVLGHAAAPGDAEHVDLVVAEFGQQPGDQHAQPGEAVRRGRRRGAADTRRVEPDHLDRRVELAHERLEQLQAGADAVDQQ